MKIRIKGNSLRIRLSKTEVELFARVGYVEESTQFISSVLVYNLKSTDDETMWADLKEGMVTMYVPKKLVENWANTNLISLEYSMRIDNNTNLMLLLEKDFKCIDAPETEDQSDYFENPIKTC